jgi:hypothetical protein
LTVLSAFLTGFFQEMTGLIFSIQILLLQYESDVINFDYKQLQPSWGSYLNGLPMSEISAITGISTGAVSNIIKNWKEKT